MMLPMIGCWFEWSWQWLKDWFFSSIIGNDWKPGGLQAAGGDRYVPLGRAGLPAQQEHHPSQHQAGEHPAGLQWRRWSADNNEEDVCSRNYKIQSLFKYKIQYFAQQVVAAPHPPLARSGLQCRCACQIKWWSWQCQWWWQWWWRQWWWWHWWWKQMGMIWMRTKKGPQDWIEAMFASSRI